MYSFQMKNIKAFSDSGEIVLKPITILVGKNSCGKSSLLRFPAMLSQTASSNVKEPPVFLFGDNLDYGNFEDVVHGKNGKSFSFSISYKIDISRNSRFITDLDRVVRITRNKALEVYKKVTVEATVSRIRKHLKVDRFVVRIEDEVLSELYWDTKIKSYVFNAFLVYEDNELRQINERILFPKKALSFDKFFPLYDDSYIVKSIIKSNNIEIDLERYILVERATYLASVGTKSNEIFTPEELRLFNIKMAFDYSSEIVRLIYTYFSIEFKNQVAYIGPFRKTPSRIYRFSETTRNHVGATGEYVGDLLFGSYQKKDGIFKSISNWLYNNYGYHIDIKDLGNNFFQIVLKDNHLTTNVIDVGFGISQVLPIVSEISVIINRDNNRGLPNNNILLVEQPELHLHPASQASLAELFTMCVTENKNARLIIETHSEHLISKLQVLIADPECPLTRDMVQILYVDKDDSGEAFIREMTITENGNFEEEWPSGFFDQGYNLAYELMKKSASRRRESTHDA